MTFHNITRKIVSGASLLATAVALALPQLPAWTGDAESDEADTVVAEAPTHRWLPGEIRDTLAYDEEVRAGQRRSLNAQIRMLARTYGDSIVLRWAAEDFVTWKFLCNRGVTIVRMEEKSRELDTIVKNFKPATLDEFRAAYSETDSLAILAMGSLYNNIVPNEDATRQEVGSVQSLYEVQEEQQNVFAVAVLTSELRSDLADRLAMRFVDKQVKKGKEYIYSIAVSEPDTTGRMVVDHCMSDILVNERYKKEPFDVWVTDTIMPPSGLQIYWERRGYSCYEIERRLKGTERWTRLTNQPYMIMLPEQDKTDCFFTDHPGTPGTYEYRILAHDPFGDLTDPSPVHTVYFPDMVPPRSPMITHINIDRPNEDDPSAEVWAEIFVEKDTLEQDFIGMIPMYYHERKTNGQWMALVERGKMMAPTDTVIRVDVTNLASGQLVVAAIDTANNMSYSMPQLLRVSDMRPPQAPTGFKAEASLEKGTITLTWDSIKDDDIDYYEVVYANDSTHTFLAKTLGKHRDTTFVDTVALDVNQKYIYYKVRAVDCATNMGEFSPMLQVIRPSIVPPTVAHLDSTHVDGNGIFMRWIAGSDQQIAYHRVYRKLDGNKGWTLLGQYDGDSIRACNNYIDIQDCPKVNPTKEYIYFVESFNYSDVSSGPSLQYMVRYTGDPVFSVPLKLYGDYDGRNNKTTLAWDADNLPKGKAWYYCIWRKGPDDRGFKFLMSAEPDENSFTDRLLRPGQEAQYYIQVQMEDGRESEPSNIVTIKAPEKK